MPHWFVGLGKVFSSRVDDASIHPKVHHVNLHRTAVAPSYIPQCCLHVISFSCLSVGCVYIFQVYLMGLVDNPDTKKGLKLWQGLDPSWEKMLR